MATKKSTVTVPADSIIFPAIDNTGKSILDTVCMNSNQASVRERMEKVYWMLLGTLRTAKELECSEMTKTASNPPAHSPEEYAYMIQAMIDSILAEYSPIMDALYNDKTQGEKAPENNS